MQNNFENTFPWFHALGRLFFLYKLLFLPFFLFLFLFPVLKTVEVQHLWRHKYLKRICTSTSSEAKKISNKKVYAWIKNGVELCGIGISRTWSGITSKIWLNEWGNEETVFTHKKFIQTFLILYLPWIDSFLVFKQSKVRPNMENGAATRDTDWNNEVIG